MKPRTWAYGVTTVSSRLDNYLPVTLRSLNDAGFNDPWLFIDGVSDKSVLSEVVVSGRPLSDYSYTLRYPILKTFGNWILGLWELYIRNPVCYYYALFQDDMVVYRNLRSYLDNCSFEGKQYWNLYTMPCNDDLSQGRIGWYPSNQRGMGAVALIFSRDGVMDLLSSRENIVERPATTGNRAWENIDGGIIDALKKRGWQEYVHNPSLVQHIGKESTLNKGRWPEAPSFRGEDFDARLLMTEMKNQVSL